MAYLVSPRNFPLAAILDQDVEYAHQLQLPDEVQSFERLAAAVSACEAATDARDEKYYEVHLVEVKPRHGEDEAIFGRQPHAAELMAYTSPLVSVTQYITPTLDESAYCLTVGGVQAVRSTFELSVALEMETTD